MKQCTDSLLPLITEIINQSLSQGVVPDSFKLAQVTPLLKKPSLDPLVMANYRPVSNLPFLSKVLERVVNQQLSDYIERNNLDERLQSAYREHHSTETALMRVQQDVLSELSEQKACLLVLLDLSSAFDTVDHNNLLHVLMDLGVTGRALEWFQSYLTGRSQCIRVDQHSSTPRPLQCGVPQGSVLGPVLFTLYAASLGRILDTFSVKYHFYADDTSIYTSFEPSNTCLAVNDLERCLEATQHWMCQKKLKLNATKTEVLLVTTKPVVSKLPAVPVIRVGQEHITPSDAVRYIGVMLDKDMTMDAHIDAICRTSQYHLLTIGRIRNLLPQKICEQLIHGLITSRLDYANG